MTRTLFVVAALLGGACGAVAGELTLAERGAAPAHSIVIARGASPSQRYAAEELRAYVKRLTGVALPVVTDEGLLPAAAIVLGETRHTAAALGGAADVKDLGEDGFRLVAKPPHLVVLGAAVRGCLYGVYELLETYGGCRWYASWHTVVPELRRFTVPDGLDVTEKPDFAMRSDWWYDVNSHHDFAARLRVNTRPWGKMEPKYGGDAFRFCSKLQSCHTFNTLLPPSKFQKDHPEYFSGSGARVQPCLTNPEVLRIVTSNVLDHIRREPTAKAYGVSQNDWFNYCTCPRCKAVDAEEGSHAGTMVRFVNAVAEAVEREFPGKIVETLAYQYTRTPPTKTKLRANVVPCLCTIECDFAYPIPESKFRENVKFRDDIRGWSPMTDQLYIWDYVCNFRHYALPFPDVYALQGNLRFFRDNKAKEMFPEGAYQGNLAGFAELKAWLLAKWMWNADRPMGPLLDDFFAGHYGKAAPYVREYFEELHRIQRERSASGESPLTIFRSVGSLPYDEAFWAKATGLFEKAKAAVADAPAVYGKNVRGAEFSVNYVRFMRLADRADCLLWLSREEPNLAAQEQASAFARAMVPVMDEYAPARLSESAERHQRETEMIRKAAARQVPPLPKRVTVGCVEEKDLRYCHTAAMGGLVDDPQAEDGRALWLANTHYEWSTAFPLSAVRYDADAKLRLRVRCRVDREPERKGEAFWAGVYDWKRKADARSISVKAESVTADGYVWYDVGTFSPNDSQTFWIGPGRFGKDGKSNIRGLYVDKIEISVAEVGR